MSDTLDYESMSDEDFETAVPTSDPSFSIEAAEAFDTTSDGTLESALDAPTAPAEDGALEEDHTTPKQTEADEAVVDPDDEDDGVADEDLGDAPAKDTPLTDVKAGAEAADKSAESAKAAAAASDEGGNSAGAPAVPEAVNYQEAYDKIMAPFKANGREIKLESPEEAIQLMQLGANYTKKMQALKPNLKMMRMLENNGLLDEEKLAFLIDIDKKSPTAIQKLLKDGSIDPMDLDTSEESLYKPGDHSVSDNEMAFHDILGDVTSSPGGKETVSHINTTWDAVSKETVYKEPAILKVINEQRGNGIYDLISTEVERRRTLGTISPDLPFIHAYKQAGDYLNEQQKLTLGAPEEPAKQILETRTAPRKAQVANGDKARAASATKSSSKVPPPTFDPFSMSDEEIMALPSPRG